MRDFSNAMTIFEVSAHLHFLNSNANIFTYLNIFHSSFGFLCVNKYRLPAFLEILDGFGHKLSYK